MLLNVAVLLFSIAAAFGVAMAAIHFTERRPPPWAVAVLHGLFIIAGFGVLFGVVAENFRGHATFALGIFALAGVGGAAMVLGWRAKPLPSALVLVHGGVALLGLAILIGAALGM